MGIFYEFFEKEKNNLKRVKKGNIAMNENEDSKFLISLKTLNVFYKYREKLGLPKI